MCVELEDIGELGDCEVNPGGGVELYVAYRKDILTFPAVGVAPNDNVLATAIVMKTGEKFTRWTFDEDTCKLDYNIIGTPGSLSVQAVLDMDFSKMTPAKARQLDGSLNGKMILLVKDGNGHVHVIGNMGRAARRTPATSSTGTTAEEKNTDKVQFTCNVGKRIFYTAAIPLTAAV